MMRALKMIDGRSSCVSESEFISLVPGGTKASDWVAMSYGSSMPFTVRPNSSNFKLISHGYFHGLMHGETFSLNAFTAQESILM
jgi:hypothetical protein